MFVCTLRHRVETRRRKPTIYVLWQRSLNMNRIADLPREKTIAHLKATKRRFHSTNGIASERMRFPTSPYTHPPSSHRCPPSMYPDTRKNQGTAIVAIPCPTIEYTHHKAPPLHGTAPVCINTISMEHTSPMLAILELYSLFVVFIDSREKVRALP